MNGNKHRSIMYIDSAYTYKVVRDKKHEQFFEMRHSSGFFERVWGVHPLADLGGSASRGIETYRFSARQTIIEGVALARGWRGLLAPVDFLLSQMALLSLLTRLIRKNKIDVILSTDAIYSGLLGLILSFRTRTPLIIGIYANYELAYRSFGHLAVRRLLPWYWLQDLLSRQVVRRADFVIAGNQNNLDWALTRGVPPERAAVITFARNVQSCHFTDPASRGAPNDIFARHNIPLQCRYMIMISRLVPVKFAEDGVRAMIAVAEHCPQAVGIVAGDGPLRPHLAEMVERAGLRQRIIFTGGLTQNELSIVVPGCITISPLTGMALVEAGLAGSPAVAYDADWQSEFVKNGVNGFVVPMGDYQQMADKTLLLMNDRALSAGLSTAMRSMAVNWADPAKIMEIERDIFTHVIKRTRGRHIG